MVMGVAGQSQQHPASSLCWGKRKTCLSIFQSPAKGLVHKENRSIWKKTTRDSFKTTRAKHLVLWFGSTLLAAAEAFHSISSFGENHFYPSKAIMPVDGMTPQKRHSRDQQSTVTIASIVLCLTTQCCLKPNRGMRIFLLGPCKAGKLRVNTFRDCERSQLHGTPSIHKPSGTSFSASVFRMSAPLWRIAMSSLGKDSKFPNSEISEYSLNWCKISWGTRKGKSSSCSFCSFSDQHRMEAQ